MYLNTMPFVFIARQSEMAILASKGFTAVKNATPSILDPPLILFAFSLNVYTEFSDKNICNSNGSNRTSFVLESSMLPQHQQDTCETQDL